MAAQYFNPRTHEGCDTTAVECDIIIMYFNPRTHEGCDIIWIVILIREIISIHAPTRGATVQVLDDAALIQISIHAPTRGATWLPMQANPEYEISIHAPTRGATYCAPV